jgi:hypothetical protein
MFFCVTIGNIFRFDKYLVNYEPVKTKSGAEMFVGCR